MAASAVHLAPTPQPAAPGHQLGMDCAVQPQIRLQDDVPCSGSATNQPSGGCRKRKCGSPPASLPPAALLHLDSGGSRHSAESDSFRLDPDTLVPDASPESQQQPSFRPQTPSSAGFGKRRRLAPGGTAHDDGATGCGPTPPAATGLGVEASPASAHMLRVPSVPPPVPVVAPLTEPAAGSPQLFDIGGGDCDFAAADPSAPAQPAAVGGVTAAAAGWTVAGPQPVDVTLEQSLLQQQVAAQHSHHQQLLQQQQQQQQALAGQQQRRMAAAAEAALQSSAARLFAVQHQAAAAAAAARATALSRCATMPTFQAPLPAQPQQKPLPSRPGRLGDPFANAAGGAALGGFAPNVPAPQQAGAPQPAAQPLPLQGGWVPAYSLPTLARLRRTTSANDAQPGSLPLYPAQPLPHQQHSMQSFAELLAAAERRWTLSGAPGSVQQGGVVLSQDTLQQLLQQRQLHQQQQVQRQQLQRQALRHTLSAGAATGASRFARTFAPLVPPPQQQQPGRPFSSASVPAQPAAAFTFGAGGFHTRNANAAIGRGLVACGPAPQPPVTALLPAALRPGYAAQPAAPQPATLQQQALLPPLLRAPAAAAPQPVQHLAQRQPVVPLRPQPAPQQRRWPPPGAPGRASGAPQLLARWGRALPLRRGETLLLALHMWERLQPKVQPARLLAAGAPQPWQAALLGCLWVAAKLEERRRGLPSASKVGELLGLGRRVVAAVEIHVMETLDWAPTAGWQSRRREFRA